MTFSQQGKGRRIKAFERKLDSTKMMHISTGLPWIRMWTTIVIFFYLLISKSFAIHWNCIAFYIFINIFYRMRKMFISDSADSSHRIVIVYKDIDRRCNKILLSDSWATPFISYVDLIHFAFFCALHTKLQYRHITKTRLVNHTRGRLHLSQKFVFIVPQSSYLNIMFSECALKRKIA